MSEEKQEPSFEGQRPRGSKPVIHDAHYLCNWRLTKNLSGVLFNYGNFYWSPKITCRSCIRRRKAVKP